MSKLKAYKEGASQRLTRELMRHSDLKLTAKIYTDPTQLPTFDVVGKLEWSLKSGFERSAELKPENGSPEHPTDDLELLKVFNAWSRMPDHLKVAIVAMAEPYYK